MFRVLDYPLLQDPAEGAPKFLVDLPVGLQQLPQQRKHLALGAAADDPDNGIILKDLARNVQGEGSYYDKRL